MSLLYVVTDHINKPHQYPYVYVFLFFVTLLPNLIAVAFHRALNATILKANLAAFPRTANGPPRYYCLALVAAVTSSAVAAILLALHMIAGVYLVAAGSISARTENFGNKLEVATRTIIFVDWEEVSSVRRVVDVICAAAASAA